jgi:two-component system LytT family response regulator
MIRSVIVDDEMVGREVLRDYLYSYCSDVEVVNMAESSKEAYHVIKDCNPDLVFLDIDMPNGNGFELLKKFPKITFKVIFVTGHDEYAVEAFRFSATDYLLKPIGPNQLREAVEKVRREIKLEISLTNIETLLLMSQEPGFKAQTVVIPNSTGFEVVSLPNIIYCKADGYLTRLFTTDKKVLVSSKNLKHYEDLFSCKGFIRTHHSFLVNMTHIRSYHSDGTLTLTDGLTAFVGSTYKKVFLNSLSGFR